MADMQPRGLIHRMTNVLIEAQSDNYLSYPMAHNRLAFLREITIDGVDPSLGSVDVDVAVLDRDLSVTRAFSTVVDVSSGFGVLAEPSILLDPAVMSQIEERRPAELIVTVSKDGALIDGLRRPVELLASRQWVRDPNRSNLSLELLASFVMPNDPAVATLVAEARERLRSATGSASTQGYQADDLRVDAIVEAIYEAARARGIAYSQPPPSWDVGDFDDDTDFSQLPRVLGGQKIRTPTEVFEGRVGTCLDTTIALASALEHVGINSMIWIVRGHAFLGYWRQDALLPSTAGTDPVTITNYIDLEVVRIVETTRLTTSNPDASFSSASHAATRNTYLTGDLGKIIAAVDVRRARRNDILPLPAFHVAPDGTSQVVEYVPTVHSGEHRVSPTNVTQAERSVVRPVPARIQSWKNSLLDLSLRNKLINFTERGVMQLAVPDGSVAHVEDRINAEQPITLLPSDQVDQIQEERGARYGAQLPQDELRKILDDGALFSSHSQETYLTRMRSLAYKAKTILEETGANNLYLALGSLHWSIDGRALKSPLILVPITLTTTGRTSLYRITLDESGTSTPNYCLVEKIRQIDGLRIPGLENPIEDESGIDLAATFTAVRQAIAEKGLPYRVEETADVAILQFAKFRLWKDLDEHWETLMTSPLVHHLVETPTQPFDDPAKDVALGDLDEHDASCPIPADASQLEAIASAVAGRTYVLEGPPGTGKSQTITNLLTRAVADGKRVLFVAEKRAALDVVSSRLASVGLGDFALDLHDKSSKPAVVREQIKRALDLTYSVDEQGIAALREDLHTARRSLSRYAKRLHERNAAGLSYYSARTQSLTLEASVTPMPIEPRHLGALDTTSIDALKHSLRNLPDVADPARPRRHHPWGFVRRHPGADQVAAIGDAASRYDAALDALPPSGPLRSVIDAARRDDDLATVASFVAAPPIGLNELDRVRTRSWTDARDHYLSTLSTFTSGALPGLDRVKPDALDLPLAEIRTAVAAAASSGFFGRKKRIAAAFAPVAAHATETVKPKEALAVVNSLLETRSRADQIAPALSGATGLRTPPSWNPWSPVSRAHLEGQLVWLNAAAQSVAADSPEQMTPFVQQLRQFVAADVPIDSDSEHRTRELSAAAKSLWEAAGTTATDLAVWLDGDSLARVWESTRSGRELATPGGLSFPRWLAFLDGLIPLRKAGLTEAADLIVGGRLDTDDAVRSLELGLAHASLAERRSATGLDVFDPVSHLKSVTRFAASTAAIRDELRTSVPQEIVKQRPFSALTERGQVGELRRELNKQRRGLKVRALLEQYGDLITQLMPCVLVSPDSVARFFPVGSQTFDLVVFDEASQIRVADAVGAIGRATSVVVVGDSKQMPPTSFAEPADGGADNELDEVLAVEDEESILTEAVQARIEQRWLTWHYRSKDEALIAFSNTQYYENKLSSFPAPAQELDHAGRSVAGVSLERVNGTFLRSGTGKTLRTNPDEADAIVAEIRRRFADSPDELPSIGVVTFNMPQRTWIEGLLRDTQDSRILEALDGTNGEGLFVKNLENVQGDERDVILFSTAFSKNEKGSLPLNFGPLGNVGGERRLNVAVTRARRKVIIFSSFDPSDLRVEDTQSRGIRDLRAYMEMADQGPSALAGPGSMTRRGVDRHRDDVAQALRDRGIAVETDLGLSDFRIDLALADPSRPNRPLVAVLLDGDGWASRRTVGDRDGLPGSVLGVLMGWRRVERVWLPEWIADRDAVVTRLLESLAGAKDDRTSGPVATATERPAVAEVATTMAFEVASGAESTTGAPLLTADIGFDPVNLPGAVEYVPWPSRRAGDRTILDALPSPQAKRRVEQVVGNIIESEGPVEFERLARLTAGAFDLTRLNQARMDSIIRCIPQAQRDRTGFAWPVGADRTTWTSFRIASSASPRPMSEIHPLEIANAMVALCRDSYGTTEDELLKETLALFGWKRRTDALVRPIKNALRSAITDGTLTVQPSGLVVAVG